MVVADDLWQSLSGIYYCLRVFWYAAARMSELELEQQMNIKYLVKLGKSGNKIREILAQVYGDNAMKKTAVYKWVKRFSEGRESVTDEERSGRPATSRTEENIAKFIKLCVTVLEHPTYSPDLAPSDFFLFPTIKEILKGRHFDDIHDIRSNTTAALKTIPQNQFQNCFDGWTRCWH